MMNDAADTEVTWHDDFYRDKFARVIIIITAALLVLSLIVLTSLSLYLTKPAPIVFIVDKDWRVQAPVPIDQAYVPLPDMLQWVSRVVPNTFNIDFLDFDNELKGNTHYFTSNGWSVFLSQLNNYVDKETLIQNKQFVSGVATGAPFVLNQGILSGRYAWWVQLPIQISYAGGLRMLPKSLTLQLLVVRVPTDDNLMGIAIDNVIVLNDQNTSGPKK